MHHDGKAAGQPPSSKVHAVWTTGAAAAVPVQWTGGRGDGVGWRQSGLQPIAWRAWARGAGRAGGAGGRIAVLWRSGVACECKGGYSWLTGDIAA